MDNSKTIVSTYDDGTVFIPQPLPEDLPGRSFTVAEADGLGVSRSRLRAADLATPSQLIRVPREATQKLIDRVRPYTQLGIRVYVSHTTAALIRGIPVPHKLEDEPFIHLSRTADCAVPRRKGVRGHQSALLTEELGIVEGVPVTTPARTWLDLAQVLQLDDLVVAGDHLISGHHRHFGQPKKPIVQFSELEEYIHGKHGVRGLVLAREALTLMRKGVDSPPETKLRLMLTRAGLPEFIPDFPIPGETGEAPVWVDLGCPEFRVCCEYEGKHHLSPQKQAEDRTRDRLTADRGWQQVKIYAADMALGEDWVVAHVVQALGRNGWRGLLR